MRGPDAWGQRSQKEEDQFARPSQRHLGNFLCVKFGRMSASTHFMVDWTCLSSVISGVVLTWCHREGHVMDASSSFWWRIYRKAGAAPRNVWLPQLHTTHLRQLKAAQPTVFQCMAGATGEIMTNCSRQSLDATEKLLCPYHGGSRHNSPWRAEMSQKTPSPNVHATTNRKAKGADGEKTLGRSNVVNCDRLSRMW